MTVAANKGNEVEEQARNMATRFRIPRCILTSRIGDHNGIIYQHSHSNDNGSKVTYVARQFLVKASQSRSQRWKTPIRCQSEYHS